MYMTITCKTGMEGKDGKIRCLASCFNLVLAETAKAERI